MTTPIQELQKECVASSNNPLSIIRKAYVYARKLKLIEMAEWLDQEMKGYEKRNETPEYRFVHGMLYGLSVRGPIPVQMPSEILSKLTTGIISQPISEIIAIVDSKKSNSIHLPFQGDINKAIGECVETESQFYIDVGIEQFKSIIDAVINTILKWTLLFEEKGILGEEISFSPEEIDKAKDIPISTYCPVIIKGDVETLTVQINSSDSTQTIVK